MDPSPPETHFCDFWASHPRSRFRWEAKSLDTSVPPAKKNAGRVRSNGKEEGCRELRDRRETDCSVWARCSGLSTLQYPWFAPVKCFSNSLGKRLALQCPAFSDVRQCQISRHTLRLAIPLRPILG